MRPHTKMISLFALLLCAFAAPALADAPVLTVWANPGYGMWEFDGSDPTPVVIVYPAGNSDGIGFSWMGDASGYGGAIAGYRFGWDLVDPDDPMDPGWVYPDFGPWEFTGQHVFASGLHNFTVVAKDTADATTTASFLIDVQEPVPVTGATWGRVKALFR